VDAALDLTRHPNGRMPGLTQIDVRFALTSGGKADVPGGRVGSIMLKNSNALPALRKISL
jgi:hypothetical protein